MGSSSEGMSGKIIVITGASSGIGKDAARRLVGLGHTVYVAARRVEQMEDLRELGCHPLRLDLSKREEIEMVAEQILEAHGGVDVLFNNAGYGLYGAFEETTIEEARYQFEVNLFGLADLTQKFLPSMRKKGQGRIINNSSVGGKIYTPLGSWYHASKHALEGWSDCLRIEMAPFGVHVIIIEPGAIQTEFGEVMADPMVRRSGDGPYGTMAHALAERQRKEYEGGGGSDPSVITDVVVEAIEARNPKPRYAAGKYAKLLIFLRKWFGDRFFDRIILSMLR